MGGFAEEVGGEGGEPDDADVRVGLGCGLEGGEEEVGEQERREDVDAEVDFEALCGGVGSGGLRCGVVDEAV